MRRLQYLKKKRTNGWRRCEGRCFKRSSKLRSTCLTLTKTSSREQPVWPSSRTNSWQVNLSFNQSRLRIWFTKMEQWLVRSKLCRKTSSFTRRWRRSSQRDLISVRKSYKSTKMPSRHSRRLLPIPLFLLRPRLKVTILTSLLNFSRIALLTSRAS